MVLNTFVALGACLRPGAAKHSAQRVAALRCWVEAEQASASTPPGDRGAVAEAKRRLRVAPLQELGNGQRDASPRGDRLDTSDTVVGFELAALRPLVGAGGPAAVSWIDLSELSALLLPGLASYTLATVCQALSIPLSAANDPSAIAQTSAEVFARLLEEVARLDLDTLMHVNRLAAPLDWPCKRLFQQAERESMKALLALPPRAASGLAGPLALFGLPAARQREPLSPTPRRLPLQVGELLAMLGRDGAVRRTLPDFEERPEQVAMARRVAGAFNGESPVLVEAGTGTGKSLAYLLPAAQFAVANGRRVVISTNTINLQDQLFTKDVPEVQRATGLPLKSVVLKGRTNYLCLRRWFALLRADDLAEHERTMLIKTLFWVRKTATGDRAELSLQGREEEAWSRVCALAETCTPLSCQFHRAGICFLARARRAAEEAHLVIVNHALLLADTVSRSRVLPEFEALVIDEAHHLEREATAQLGWRSGQRELNARLTLLLEASITPATGVVAEVCRLLRKGSGGRPGSELERAVARLEEQLAAAVDRVRQQSEALFALFRMLLKQHGQQADGQVVARVSSAVRSQPLWSEAEVASDELISRIQHLVALLAALERKVDESVSGDADAWADVGPELVAQHVYWEDLAARLAAVLSERQAELIAWLTGARNDDTWLSSAPLHVGPMLRDTLFADKDTLVLTSATLSTEGHFRYVKERLGLEEADELLLGSPFDYRRAALVVLPGDIPEPARPGYQEGVQQAILELAMALGGRCLALFTSYAQLRATYQALREPLAAVGVTLLAQGADGISRAALLEAFKAGRRTVLFGTSSFWEGVDVVGEALSCVIMPRLPFSVPTDPVFEARSEQFEDPFTQYAVPQAILRFKQGFGRLIRSRTDRGAVVMLDRRLETKFYGRAFLRSLPGCTFERVPLGKVGTRVQQWLDATPQAGQQMAGSGPAR